MRIIEKLLVLFLPIFLLSVVAVTLLSRQAATEELLSDAIRTGTALGTGLSQNPELISAFRRQDTERLQPVIELIGQGVGAVYVMVQSPTGTVIAHTDTTESGRTYRDQETVVALAADKSIHHEAMWRGQAVMDVVVPVLDGAGLAEVDSTSLRLRDTNNRVATLRIGLSLDVAKDTARRISKEILWIVTMVNLLVLGASLFYVRNTLRPVRQMARATERIAGGQLGEMVPVVSRDEMGDLAHSFNHMSRELALTTVSADFLDRVVDSMRDVLVVMNTDGSIRRVNQATARLLDYEEGDLLGRSATHLFEDVDGLFTNQGLFDLDLDAGVVAREGQICQRDGTTIPVLLSVAAFQDRDGRLAGFIATAADITERIRAEQETRRSLYEKEVLLKEIHHRVKNNLQIISSLLNLQSGHDVGDRTRELFSDSQSRIKAMALIHETLYLSEDLARVDFHDYLNSLAITLYQTYRRDNQTLDLRVDAQHVHLGIDQAIPCGLIINELVSNALKHGLASRDSGIVDIRFQAEEGSLYRLDVADDGVGLPADFELGGDSLGLKLIVILTRQLAGEVTVAQATQGAHFTLRFSVDDNPVT
ncbi:MAG: HAMP domain-containing protein [Gemmatimonadetes bacterium]|jgi:PAS domain S-box-containing protein|nr:HAMP domain-containing protein [Gemmatimonadota bacterium]MBT5589063.1 HAMP domain-containing protein [Gemmatimonadota bacterium]MBT5962955.1 HAMP domain-containing protein [Gemmatimonadota bacterium]MBT7456869.1 HAMP domain-containing protein [Gemmatimonadota bacterium]MBT7598692.1 HAMP domain-containing protein [Gemmatimonadota bacterium]